MTRCQQTAYLDDDCVAAGQCRCDLPDHHKDGKAAQANIHEDLGEWWI
jgi:hypothetical protein